MFSGYTMKSKIRSFSPRCARSCPGASYLVGLTAVAMGVLMAGIVLFSGLSPTFCVAAQGGEKKQPSDADSPYISFDDAVKRVRSEYLPMVVYFDGGASAADKPSKLRDKWEDYLKGRFFRRKLRGLLVVRLTDKDLEAPYPGGLPEHILIASKAAGVKRPDKDQPAGRTLGVDRGYPALLLVDFRERVVRRYVQKLPSKGKLEKQFKVLGKKNRAAATRARKVEKGIEESLYAAKLKRFRESVQKLLPFLEKKFHAKLDLVTQYSLAEAEEKHRKVVRKVTDDIAALEKTKKYAQAIELLDDLAKDYPFSDVLKKCHETRGRIFRKARAGL